MGRRLNISEPTVIHTELVPLDESFYVDVDRQTEQWYYDNTQQYAPNRKITPLTLTPKISVFDKDTGVSYNPSFYNVRWFESAYHSDYTVQYYFAVSAYDEYSFDGNNYPSDITSWKDNIRVLLPLSKPYIWRKTVTTINGSTTETYEVLKVGGNHVYILGYAFTDYPASPEEGDVVLVFSFVEISNDYVIYKNGEWVEHDASEGDSFLRADDPTGKELFTYTSPASGGWEKTDLNNINGGYIETEITNTTDSGSADYVKIGRKLLVKKNVSYSHAVTIHCIAVYIDPRDAGSTFSVEDRTTLTTNRASEVVFPTVNIISPSSRSYNPLVDDTDSQYNFYGIVVNSPVQPLITDVRRYKANMNGAEEIVLQEDSANLTLTIRYGETVMNGQQFSRRKTADGTLAGEDINTAYVEKVLGYSTVKGTSLLHAKGVRIKTTGINQFNEEWEDGLIDPSTGQNTESERHVRTSFIPAFPSTQYTTVASDYPNETIFIYQYDENKQFLATSNQKTTVTRDNCHYIRLRTLKGRQNRAMLYMSENLPETPSYESYKEYFTQIPVDTIIGRLDSNSESVTVFSDGMKSVTMTSDARDEIKVDGGYIKAVVRVGCVDLGTLDWHKSQLSSDLSSFLAQVLEIKGSKSSIRTKNSKYTDSLYYNVVQNLKDKCVFTDDDDHLLITDSSYTDVASFKASLQGVMLNYVLAEPVEYIVDPITEFVWYGIKNRQEVLADTLPWYVSGQGTGTLKVDAMFGEDINVVLRVKMFDGEDLSPSKAYASLRWRIPDIDSHVQCNNGGAVRSDTVNMTFNNIVNVNGTLLSDSIKNKHLRFNWKIRKDNSTEEIDKGWGNTVTISASDLRNVRGSSGGRLASTLVYNNVYVLGAWKVSSGQTVLYDKPTMTKNGVTYERTID